MGNNRVVIDIVVQQSDHYPFGMEFADNSNQDEQPYKYNDKELDKLHGLNMYDYSARYMELAIGRFTSVDPLAELYYSISPYAYVGNNPLKYVDPYGRLPIIPILIRIGIKFDVQAIKSMGSGVGNKNIINNATRDTKIKEITNLGKIVEGAMNTSVDFSVSTITTVGSSGNNKNKEDDNKKGK